MSQQISILCALFLCSVFEVSASAADETGYFYTRTNPDREVVHIHFMGSAKWLASQNAPAAKFHKLPELHSLTLNQHSLSLGELQYIASLKRVTELEIGLLPDEVEIARGVLMPLKNMKSLERLSVSANGMIDEDFAFLGKLPRLEEFTVDGDSEFSDRLIFTLAELKRLKRLHLKGRFTEAAIASLTIHQSLENLYIDSPLLTDRAIAAVSLLPNLVELNGKPPEKIAPTGKSRDDDAP